MYRLEAIAEDFCFIQFTNVAWPASANIVLIVDSDGLNLVDAGLNGGETAIVLEECVGKLGLALSDIHTIYLTHGHTDHVGGVNYVKQFATPRVFIPPGSIAEATDPKVQENAVLPDFVRTIAPRLKDYDILDNFRRSCGDWVLDAETLEPLEAGSEVAIGRYRFCLHHTPGHDTGLTVFFEPDRGFLITGDLLRSSPPGNSLPWYSSSGGGVGQYLDSLERVAGLDVAQAFPAHGGVIGEFTAQVEKTRGFLISREERILQELALGPQTCEQLDPLLYSPMALEVCPWYSSTTEAHLAQLIDHGRVARRGLDYALAEGSSAALQEGAADD